MSNFQPGQLALEIDADTADPVMSSSGGIEVVNASGAGVVLFAGASGNPVPGSLAVFIPAGETGSIRAKPRREPIVTFRQIGRSLVNPTPPAAIPGTIAIDPGDSPIAGGSDAIAGFDRVVIRQNRIVVTRNQNGLSLTFG